MTRIFLFIAIFQLHFAFFDAPSYSNSEGEKHADEEREKISPSVGPGKAITEASKENGFKLSDKAIQVLGIQAMPLAGSYPFQVPPSALVYFQDEVGVYRRREGSFKLIPVKILQKSGNQVTIEADELRGGDFIAKRGVGFLRVADLEAFGGAEAGHGH